MANAYAKISFHAAAALYTGGTVAQLLKLFLSFSWTDMPFVIDWVIVVLGSIGACGLIWFQGAIAYRGVWERIVHWAIVLHLVASVALHVWTIGQGNHELYAAFPREYSYFAVVYFGLFAWRSWTVRLQGDRAPNAI
ncbi:MAG: hypothetical protein OEM25_07230 [Gammaproteobacteria bacterium]|nr:hypothetical protein [Gammaproteobacteria bacterium]